MRSEKEMLDLITKTAEEDPRIRAAYLEGSRVNPNVPADIFQDYDVVYVVRETKSFREDASWIDRFGKRLYMQYPEDSVYFPSDAENCYGWLMQFADGNRLDLHVCTMETVRKDLELFRVLVDKDNLLPADEVRSDEIYWIQKPTPQQFHDTCNEFWLSLNNVAKGQSRDELPYLMYMNNLYNRPLLTRILEWKIGADNHFNVSVGKCAKYMKRFVSEDIYTRYLATYSAAEPEAVWDAVFVMCGLFHETAVQLSGEMDCAYDYSEAENSRAYLEHVRKLPGDAKEIYPGGEEGKGRLICQADY